MKIKDFNFRYPLIMGIVNLTPDSFFDGGKFFDVDNAEKHINELIDAGADIIDLGAESTRPGYQEISIIEELERLRPVLTRIFNKLPIPFSIDTAKPEVAEEALALGASMINSTGRNQTEVMAKLAQKYKGYLAIMFRGPFKKENIINELQDFFRNQTEIAMTQGVPANKLIIDPGFGFDMDTDSCITILQKLDSICTLGFPVLVGMSNKRFIGAGSDSVLEKRLPGNIAAEIFAIEKGAKILRVHNVEASKQSLKMYLTLNGEPING